MERGTNAAGVKRFTVADAAAQREEKRPEAAARIDEATEGAVREGGGGLSGTIASRSLSRLPPRGLFSPDA